ncbi:MAG: HAD family hydrolase [Bacteroidia bacterium]
MKLKNKIAIFDFCETLTNFQTADRFVNFILKDNNCNNSVWVNTLNRLIYIMTLLRVFAILNIIAPRLNLSKRILLLKLRGVSKEVIHAKAIDYLEKVINPRINRNILERLREYKRNGYLVFISSGGYEPYLNLFSKQEGIDKLFCTQIEFIKGKATGFIKGKDCMFINKVTLLEEYLKANKITFEDSVVYSDSFSDLPLLKWANSAYVISYNNSRSWVVKGGFNEIIIKDESK